MSWKEIGKAINDTLIKGRLKPLNRIIEDEAYDTFFNTAIALETENATNILLVTHGTVSIADSEFEGFTQKTVIFPNTLKSIGSLAFRGAELRSVVIPPSVTHLGDGAFMECANLIHVILPKYVEKIDDDTFGNTAIESVTIPKYVKQIGRLAFGYNSNLRCVVFKGKPDSIADNAFANDTLLSDIYVPWNEGEVANAPWGAPNGVQIHYGYEV